VKLIRFIILILFPFITVEAFGQVDGRFYEYDAGPQKMYFEYVGANSEGAAIFRHGTVKEDGSRHPGIVRINGRQKHYLTLAEVEKTLELSVVAKEAVRPKKSDDYFDELDESLGSDRKLSRSERAGFDKHREAVRELPKSFTRSDEMTALVDPELNLACTNDLRTYCSSSLNYADERKYASALHCLSTKPISQRCAQSIGRELPKSGSAPVGKRVAR
jgi:hypothetical protein